MKISSDRIKARHWIPVNGNGKINFRNCSNTEPCQPLDNEETENQSVLIDQKDINRNDQDLELNSTENMEAVTEQLVMNGEHIVVEQYVIQNGAEESNDLEFEEQTDLLSAVDNVNYEKPKTIDNQYSDVEGGDIDGNDSNEIDGIGGHSDAVHVFSMSSVNTTKSVSVKTIQKIATLQKF